MLLKRFCSHGNSLCSSPHPHDFNMLVIFSSKNAKQGYKLELTYLYACWIIHAGAIGKYEKRTLKVARNAFNIGEVWNPVCCHGNKTFTLMLAAPLVEPYCKKSDMSVTNWLRYRFPSYLIKIWLSI